MADFKDLQVCGQLYDCDFGLFNTLTVTVGTNGYQVETQDMEAEHIYVLRILDVQI
jgi:hypothetical protein